MTQHPRQYDRFAEIYARHMAADFARRMLPIIDRLLLSRLAPKARIIDLCCGSGAILRELAHRGFRVVGLDASEPMLRLARNHAPGAKLLAADARRFAMPAVFDAALSTFNSLAHCADPAELAAVFSNLRAALKPGAPFLFDLTMEEGYATKWRGAYLLEDSGHSCSVEPSFDPALKLARNQIRISDRNGTTVSQFEIVQKCHSLSEITSALRQSGFSRITSHDAESDSGVPGEHRFFVCS